MKGGQKPLHLWGSWAPADFLGDELVKVLGAKGDTVSLTVYFFALQWSRLAGGDLPADPEELAAVLGLPTPIVRQGLRVWISRKKLVKKNGRLFHPRVFREVQDDLSYRKKASELGKEGALKRWGLGGVPHRELDAPPIEGGDGLLLAPHPTPTPTSSPHSHPSSSPAGRPAGQTLRVDVDALLDEVSLLGGGDRIDELAAASTTPRGKVLDRVKDGSGAWLEVVKVRLGRRLRVLKAEERRAPFSYHVPPHPDPDALHVWLKAVEVLAEKLDPHTFAMWIRPMVPVALAGTELRLWVPAEDFGRTMVGEKHGPAFQSALDAAGVTLCGFVAPGGGA